MGDPCPPSVYLRRCWHHSRDKKDQAFPLCFCKLQVIKNWTVRRPGNKTASNLRDCTDTYNDINSEEAWEQDYH